MPHNMPLNSSNKTISTGLKTLNAAVIAALIVVSNANAAGLGKLTVLSSLGQPLRAELELTSVSKDEEGSLAVKLASVNSYKQANIDFNPALLSLQFSIEQRGTRKFVQVNSTQPINEPFIDMLLELNSSSSRLVREYAVLLDPPVTQRAPQLAQVTGQTSSRNSTITSASTVKADRLAQSSMAEKISPTPRSTAKVESKATSTGIKSEQSDSDYHVKAGDNLSSIAGQNLPAGVSLDQMLVALYRSNESAFLGKNMNRLRAGQILSIPDADAAHNISKSEARNVVLAQAKDFKNYRNTLASQVESAMPSGGAGSKQSGGGKITAKVEEQSTPASVLKDKLKVSRATGASAVANATIEDKIARDKAAAEAAARIKDLEKNVDDLQKLLKLQSKHMEELQNQANNAKLATPAPDATVKKLTPVESPAPIPPAAVVKPTPPAPPLPPVPPPAPAPLASSPTPSAAPPAPPVPSPMPPAIATASSPPVVAAVKPLQAPAPKPKIAPPPPPPEPSLLESVMGNPLLLPAGGVLLLVLVAVFGYRAWRNKRQQAEFLNSSSGASIMNSGLKNNSLFGSTGTGGQSVDTKNSIFNSNFVPSVSHLDTNVDPVAEADVYIAYGRDAQAEEILKEALRSQPTRNAIRVKLLEIYANRKDTRSFEILASELYSLTRGEGEEWQQVVTLGNSIDSTNPLYSSGKLQEQVIAKANAITAPTQPMSQLDFDALSASTEPRSVVAPMVEQKVPAQLLEQPLVDHQMKVAQTQSMDMDFDLGELGKKEPESTTLPTPSDAQSMFDVLDFELGKGESIDAALPNKTESHLGQHASTNAKPVTPTLAASPGDLPMEFNLADMNFDLDDIPAAVSVSHAPTTAAVSVNPEMATKLDLAVAYQEIGDKEGARELLEEVLKGGSAEQIGVAKTLLAKL